MLSIQSFLLFLFLGPIASATISSGFQGFITRQYGANVTEQLAREDQGVNGSSFGGAESVFPIRTYRNALVFVHGLNSNAGSMLPIQEFFIKKGYGQNELYATTYGPENTIINENNSMICDYVKQVRQFLIAVRAYTQQPIDVASYSLGVPIARKAILGGKCVDTGEDIGSPITSSIRQFLSTAGANQGAKLCSQTSVVPGKFYYRVSKHSDFIADINTREGYEAERIFSIRSTSDEVVSYNLSALSNSQFNNFTHVDTCLNTLWTQLSLIATGHVREFFLNKDSNAESKLVKKNCSGEVTADNNNHYGNEVDDDGDEGEYDVQKKQYNFPNGNSKSQHLPESPKGRQSEMAVRTAFVLFLFVTIVQGTLTDGFLSYITRQYGSQAANQLARKDLGVNGSYGGNLFSFPIRILRDPVILIHGLNADAGATIPVRDFFIKKRIRLRMLVQAVSSYTQKNVVIIGYSLGGPVARKVILGACNLINGLNKNSQFVKDINSKQGYEGQRRYLLRDSTDDVVGFNQSNIQWSTYAGSQINVTFNNFSHVDSLFNTLWTQWSLVASGYASKFAIEKDARAESKLTGKNCSGSAVGNPTSSPWQSPWSGTQNEDQNAKPTGGEYDRQLKIFKFANGYYYAHQKLPANFFGSNEKLSN
ncbi:Lipase EstA/Esterase EstB family-containing protein [Aphelenchoides besseyi]|nr:Lipase EstA/Esterase EstB family-containing protein [Aphelenchoides besseyi]